MAISSGAYEWPHSKRAVERKQKQDKRTRDQVADMEDDQYASIHWDEQSTTAASGGAQPSTSAGASSLRDTAGSSLSTQGATSNGGAGLNDGYSPAMSRFSLQDRPELPKWQGFLMVQVSDARKEGEGSRDAYISYGIRAEVSAATSANSTWR